MHWPVVASGKPRPGPRCVFEDFDYIQIAGDAGISEIRMGG